jgi:hypothetical protein
MTTNFMVQRLEGKNPEGSSDSWSDTLWVSNFKTDDVQMTELSKAVAAMTEARKLFGLSGERGTDYTYRLVFIYERL